MPVMERMNDWSSLLPCLIRKNKPDFLTSVIELTEQIFESFSNQHNSSTAFPLTH